MRMLRVVCLFLGMVLPSLAHAQYGCWGGVCEMPPEPVYNGPVYVPRPLSVKDLLPWKEDIFSVVAASNSGAVTTAMSFDTLEDALQSARETCEEKSPGETCTFHEMSGRICAGVVRGKSAVYVYGHLYEDRALKGAKKRCRKGKQKPCIHVATDCSEWLPPGFPARPTVRWYEAPRSPP